ncbi:MAG TPA: hypothetical protein VF169_27715 [Albitalea sp.]|uniref:hypothetical protein n=1 Tax=Piscinibacter sp. TaxID=1903157 RepID=UPI002ED4CF0E
MGSFIRIVLLAIAAAVIIAGCGGAGGGSTAAADDPSAPTTDLQLVAIGNSASTVSLGWKAGAAGVVIERKSGAGAYEAIATLDAGASYYLDTGLARHTTYAYRLVALGASQDVVAERSATTGDDDAVITAVGTEQGAGAVHTVGAAGGRLVSPDGAVSIDVPAGAFAADTEITLQGVTNTAPDGRDDGLRVRLAAAPAKPLTLRFGYGDALMPQADGLRIAMQRNDGSWLSLPLAQADKATRTLSSTLLPDMLAPLRSAQAAAAGRGASVAIEFRAVKYLAFHLAPKKASVPVGRTLALVPYARTRVAIGSVMSQCETDDDGLELCLASPILDTKEIPFLNEKAGFARKWLVFLQEGGDATYGRVAASGSVGATYTAPREVPDPRTVIVSFQSTSAKTGRTLVLSSAVTIVGDTWTGTMSAVDGPSDAGTTIKVAVPLNWNRDPAASSGTITRYRATGTMDVEVLDDGCTTTVTPSQQPVSADPQLAMLEIDDSVSPPTYKARLITFWNASLTAVCPKASATRPALVGWGWDVQGTLSGDGSTIQGSRVEGSVRLDWSFTR